MQQTHTHKAVSGRVEAKKLLSRRRQLEYRYFIILTDVSDNRPKKKKKRKKHRKKLENSLKFG